MLYLAAIILLLGALFWQGEANRETSWDGSSRLNRDVKVDYIIAWVCYVAAGVLTLVKFVS